MVRALNKRDLGALETVLDQHPGALNTSVAWSSKINDTDGRITRYNAAQAAVRMNWMAALPLMAQAGEQFKEQPYPNAGALGLAVRARNSSQSKQLLSLGADADGVPGSPPLRHLRQKTVDPSKEKASSRVLRVFSKHGFDPWRRVGESSPPVSIPEHLLSYLAISPCLGVLEHAHLTQQNAPDWVQGNPKRYWGAMGRCLEQILDHDRWDALTLNAPLLQKIVTTSCSLGLDMGVDDALALTDKVIHSVEKYRTSPHRNQAVAGAWIQMCNTFLTVAVDPDDMRSELACRMSGHAHAMGDACSQWVRDILSSQIVGDSNTARPRPRL